MKILITKFKLRSYSDFNYNETRLYEFKKKYLVNADADKLLVNIDLIIKNINLIAYDKQLNLEKLLNVYYLSKEESKYELNPFWWNEIEKIFISEYLTFEQLFLNSLLNIKTNYFKLINLKILFIPKEIFSLFIYGYLNLLKLNINNDIPKSSTLISNIVETNFKFFKHKYYLYLAYEYLLKKFKINFEKSIEELILQNTNWKTFLKSEINNLNISFDIEYDLFKVYIASETEEIKRFIYQIIQHTYHILIYDIGLFEKKVIYSNKKQYDYCDVFDISKFNSLSTFNFINCNLPMLVEPLDWDYKGESGGYLLNKNNQYMTLTKNLTSGSSSISYNNSIVDTINLLQKKSYSISNRYYKYIFTNLYKFEHEIPLDLDIYDIYNKLEIVKLKYTNFLKINDYPLNIIYIYKEDLNSLYFNTNYINSSKEKKTKLFNELKLKYRITDELLSIYSETINIKKLFQTQINKYQSHYFLEKITLSYLKHKFYIVNRCDFRTRMFPISRVLNRASGNSKYMLISNDDKYVYNSLSILRLKEFSYLQYIGSIESYSVLELQTKFDLLISEFTDINSVLKDLTIMLNTVNNNNIILYENKKLYQLILKSKSIILFLFSLFDYYSYLNNNNFVSELFIDYDQCSSGPMIYSLLSFDKNMGNLTNVYSNNPIIRNDLYMNFLTEFFKEFNSLINYGKYHSQVDSIKRNITKYFDRKFSKSIIMPTFYNMGDTGLKEKLFELFNKHSELNSIRVELVYFFTDFIKKLLNKLYPHTINFQKQLTKISNFIFNLHEWIFIRTLDNCVIKYKYLESKDLKGSIFRNNKYITYRIYLSHYYGKNSFISKHQKISFAPNYIHSLDGSLCRCIINIYYLIYNTILEPLHDSFRLSFNNLYKLDLVIKYVYSYYFFNSFFHEFELGIENNKLVFNSINYLNYKCYFLPYENDILNHTLLNILKYNLSTDVYNKLIKILDLKLLFPKTDKDHFLLFINSNFVYYF